MKWDKLTLKEKLISINSRVEGKQVKRWGKLNQKEKLFVIYFKKQKERMV